MEFYTGVLLGHNGNSKVTILDILNYKSQEETTDNLRDSAEYWLAKSFVVTTGQVFKTDLDGNNDLVTELKDF